MIELKGLWLTLGDFRLQDIDLTIGDGEYFVVLGPTGAGKSILIQCIAGLHRIRRGEIWIDGMDVTGVAPEERQVGYVPQDYVLFPFLDVGQNIVFGLGRTKLSRADVVRKVEALANLTGISHLLRRGVSSLSGGERQRVALARALAPSPGILLLDEPLSALDMQTAKYLRLELRRIQRELGITVVHITHNQMEAEEMADRIAVLNVGRLEQVGRPEEVFFYPNSEAVSGFIGTPNILDCDHCRHLGQGLVEVDCGGLPIILPHEGNMVKRIALSPRYVYVYDTEPPGPQVNRFKGIVSGIKSFGTMVRLEVNVEGHSLLAEVSRDRFEDMDLALGMEVFLILKFRRIRVYEDKNNAETRQG